MITGPVSAQELSSWAQDAVVRITAGYISGGTGFIFDTEGETGFVVTAQHVIEDADSFDVEVMGREYKGTLLGYNSEEDVDVAVLSICCNSDFHSLPWENGGTAQVGDPVMAMGRPRNVPVSTTGKAVDDSTAMVYGLVSHDAPIQSGSSGGPLLTMDGKILGVNVATSTLRDRVYYAVPYAKIAAQVVEWKSQLVVLDPTPRPTVAATPSELTFSGVGSSDLFWSVSYGRYIVTATVKNNDGDSFSADFEHVTTEDDWSFWEYPARNDTFSYLVNVGDGSEQYSFERDLMAGRQLVKVSAEGSWTITFEPVQ